MIDFLFTDHRHGHSTWQIDNGITVRSGGTLYGCYKQALREAHKRWRGLRELYLHRALLEIDIEELESQEGMSPLACRRRDLQVAEKRLALIEGAGVIRDTESEFLRFVGQALACRRAIGLNDDEPMPDELREKLDAEMWAHNIRSMAAVDYLTQRNLGRNTVELLASAPLEQRRHLLAEICNPERHEALIDGFMEAQSPMPAPVVLTPEESRRALACVSKPSALLHEPGLPLREALRLGQSTVAG